MTTVYVDDRTAISYRTVGTGPPTLLFMHGWSGSGAYFDQTLAHLELTRARAITFDLRGHGDSDKTESGYDLDRFAADAVAVADDAHAETVVLVGFSMSAKFVQYVSCVHPDRVLGQILVAGAPATTIPLPPDLLSDWYGRANDAERLIEIAESYAVLPIAAETLRRFGEDAAKVPLVALEGSMHACLSTSFVDRLADIHVPTLVVGGMSDPIFTPEVLRDGVVGSIPGARLALLPCGHEIPLERPQELAALIEAFLAGLGDARSRPNSA